MAKINTFFGEREVEDYSVAIQKVNVLRYASLETQKEKKWRWQGYYWNYEFVKKKCFNYINIRLVKAQRESVVNETKVRTMLTDTKAYEDSKQCVSGGLLDTLKSKEFFLHWKRWALGIIRIFEL